MNKLFGPGIGSATPRLNGWRSRPSPDRGRCARCSGAEGESSWQHVGSSTACWGEVQRCASCGGYRLRLERRDHRLSAAEAELALTAAPGELAYPSTPPVAEVVAERADTGADGRWVLPPWPDGLEFQTVWFEAWSLEALAVVADVLHREEPGSSGRVYTARWMQNRYEHESRPFASQGWRIELPFRLDATWVWDHVDVRHTLFHDRWLEAGAPRNGLVDIISAHAPWHPRPGHPGLVYAPARAPRRGEPLTRARRP